MRRCEGVHELNRTCRKCWADARGTPDEFVWADPAPGIPAAVVAKQVEIAAAAARGPCKFRSPDAIRLQECPPCAVKRGGKAELAVFSCQIHVECTPQTKLEGIACCVGCSEYVGIANDAVIL